MTTHKTESVDGDEICLSGKADCTRGLSTPLCLEIPYTRFLLNKNYELYFTSTKLYLVKAVL